MRSMTEGADGGALTENASLPSPSVAFGATSPLRGRISKFNALHPAHRSS